MSQPSRHRRWLPWAAGAALAIVVIAGVVVYLSSRQGDVSNPNVEFRPTTQATVAEPPAKPHKPVDRRDPPFTWPVYGYTRDRNASFQPDHPGWMRPPYHQDWKISTHVLLEFPPVLGGRDGYILRDDAALIAFRRKTGRTLWKRSLGTLAASSPAYAHGMLYAVILQRSKAVNAGRVVALNARTGHVRWSKPLPSRAESSPLVAHGRLYFGSEDGTVYCLRTSNGRELWSYHAGGAVKGGVAMDGSGNIYFGAYGGTAYSLRARDGHVRWTVGTSGGTLGLSAGNFYSTPAVAYGRVYMGNTDGNVYSFGTGSGALAWRRSTGAYVYSSAAVAAPGGKPTVYVGSYDGNLYAFDARTGATRWTHPAGGRISGGVVVLGDLVFFSVLEHHTEAVDARTGRTVYKTDRGEFNPVVSDGRRIYLVGSSVLYGLTSKRARKAERAARHRAEIASRRRSRSG